MYKRQAVQAVNVPAAKINVNIIAIFFFMLSPSFQATSISKDFGKAFYATLNVKTFCKQLNIAAAESYYRLYTGNIFILSTIYPFISQIPQLRSNSTSAAL